MIWLIFKIFSISPMIIHDRNIVYDGLEKRVNAMTIVAFCPAFGKLENGPLIVNNEEAILQSISSLAKICLMI